MTEYVVSITVEVPDDLVGEDAEYAAYAQAKADLVENQADWFARCTSRTTPWPVSAGEVES